MNLLKKMIRSMTLIQWIEVLAVTGFTIYFAVTNTEDPMFIIIMNALAAICGILCVVLCAGGKRSQYFWGFINIVAYVVVAFKGKLYGEVMLNGLYYLPSQFIGMWLWKKHKDTEDESIVKCKKLTWKATGIMLACSGLSIWLYQMVLEKLGGNSTWLDSTSTCFSVIANALMLLRYREQWLLWIIVDAVTVAMWAIQKNPTMTVMWAFYLLNAVYGWIIWSKKRKRFNETNE